MTSPLCVATGGWCRRVFHYRPPTPMYRNSPPLCTIELQIPSLMPLKMRKVQAKSATSPCLRPAIPACTSYWPVHIRRTQKTSTRFPEDSRELRASRVFGVTFWYTIPRSPATLLPRRKPPDTAGGFLFFRGLADGQCRVTTIVVVVNIYIYNYYYVCCHFQLPFGILMYVWGRGSGSWRIANTSNAVGNSGTGFGRPPTRDVRLLHRRRGGGAWAQ